MVGVIYKITNSFNNKVYIGKTCNGHERRFKQHIYCSKIEEKSHTKFMRALKKYGHDNFSIEVIDTAEEDLLEDLEIYYIKLFDSYRNGYNSTIGGDGRRYKTFSDEDVLKEYENVKNITKVSLFFKTSRKTIKYILESYEVELKPFNEVVVESINSKYESTICVCKEDKVITVTMNKLIELMSNDTSASINRIREGIRNIISGKRKSYLGYHIVK